MRQTVSTRIVPKVLYLLSLLVLGVILYRLYWKYRTDDLIFRKYEEAVKQPEFLFREEFFKTCSAMGIKFLFLSEYDISNYGNPIQMHELRYLNIFAEDIERLNEVLFRLHFQTSVYRSRLTGAKLVYAETRNYSKTTTISWQDRSTTSEELLLVGFILFKKTLLISVIYESGSVEGRFSIIPYSDSFASKAFPTLDMKLFKPVRLFNYTNFFYPSDISQFLWYLEAADFIQCNYSRAMEVENANRVKNFMKLIVGLRKVMASWQKRVWIFAGTLLGWYRQCSIIGHDHDTDTAMFIDDYEPWMMSYFLRHPYLKIYVKFGRQNDSLEFKFFGVGPKKWETLDLFWMYQEKNFSWVGIQTFDSLHRKKVSFYPLIRRICSGELHGYLVYVPCDPLPIIELEYGKNWKDVNQKYSYNRDAFNYVYNGSWTNEEWGKGGSGEVYTIYNYNGQPPAPIFEKIRRET